MTELTSAPPEGQTSPAEPSFRPVKRRRHYRRRSEDGHIGPLDAPATSRPPAPESTGAAVASAQLARERDDDHDDDRLPLAAAAIVRLRKHARHRRGGIEFAPGDSDSARAAMTPASTDLVVVAAAPERDAPPEPMAAIVNRFAPQTGQVADVNRHMMAFIDAELARLHHGDGDDAASGVGPSSSNDATPTSRPGQLPRQPATLGKLHEVDLGPNNKLHNIARTEAATKRVGGGPVEDPTASESTPTLGKNGKPWRTRKRRTSDDIKRDQLVEEVLRESRIELYDEPDMARDADDTQAADDRIAEQFRRDFLDAVSSRHRRRFGASKAAAAKAGKKDDRPKGPKLGGSRSARAAMREQQEKAKR